MLLRCGVQPFCVRAIVVMRFKTFLVRFSACLVLAALPVHAARAESFFQKLFNWGSGSSAKSEAPVTRNPVPSMGSFSRSGASASSTFQMGPSDDDRNGDDGDTNGAYRTLCVRTCDGYYFPISSRASSRRFSRDARQCEAMCGSESKLFYLPKGSDDVKNMTDTSGRVYGRLPTAFAYRKALINGCSCKPMPWSSAETARHDQYALIESLDKAQVRNAELASAAASAQQELGIAPAPDAPSSATVALKLAAAMDPVETAAAAVPVPESTAPQEGPLGITPSDMTLGHLLPDPVNIALANDPVITSSVASKRPRKLTAKYSALKVAQTGTWFSAQATYAWPGDAPVRHR